MSQAPSSPEPLYRPRRQRGSRKLRGGPQRNGTSASPSSAEGGEAWGDGPTSGIPTPSSPVNRRPGGPAPRRRSSRTLASFAIGLGLGVLLGQNPPLSVAPLLAAIQSLPERLQTMGWKQAPVLVLGSDVVGGNTDVMFAVQVDKGITTITQLPRDTYVESPRLGVVKANALYGELGPAAVKEEASRLLGFPVARHFKVNLDAVAKVADALGGVEVDVPKRMFYVDNSQGLLIDLYPGPQVLKGKELEGFLRFRHDEEGDLGRMQRQRTVINQVFAKLAQPATLARLPALLQIAGQDIRTDLSPLEMTRLVSAMAHTRLSTRRLPGREYWENDLSYWMPDSNSNHPSGNGEPPPP
ncbi:MAG: LCP family protein [Cyanobium sp.]